ncbi:hypothetical protein VCRA2126O85_10103 [Vibrio crassostreae]|nr:hypothetical protein VCRA2128O100_10103 [Vibrio crassostreae]CAK2696498.1 hypothetical protein VCRA2128O106_10103 [Vibrio crassostreae]CAK2697450.1 hypothetical protein VCRA2125O83_10103 [Vibrio crassostreae]CAK2700737.1 hypothetical protein VCRA2126O86_10103 [Vibrio crassostreae]CAK2704149.1 hypothetical protein VCRA2126O85_10103 [Vibrio crassostreae]
MLLCHQLSTDDVPSVGLSLIERGFYAYFVNVWQDVKKSIGLSFKKRSADTEVIDRKITAHFGFAHHANQHIGRI